MEEKGELFHALGLQIINVEMMESAGHYWANITVSCFGDDAARVAKISGKKNEKRGVHVVSK